MELLFCLGNFVKLNSTHSAMRNYAPRLHSAFDVQTENWLKAHSILFLYAYDKIGWSNLIKFDWKKSNINNHIFLAKTQIPRMKV